MKCDNKYRSVTCVFYDNCACSDNQFTLYYMCKQSHCISLLKCLIIESLRRSDSYTCSWSSHNRTSVRYRFWNGIGCTFWSYVEVPSIPTQFSCRGHNQIRSWGGGSWCYSPWNVSIQPHRSLLKLVPEDMPDGEDHSPSFVSFWTLLLSFWNPLDTSN